MTQRFFVEDLTEDQAGDPEYKNGSLEKKPKKLMLLLPAAAGLLLLLCCLLLGRSLLLNEGASPALRGAETAAAQDAVSEDPASVPQAGSDPAASFAPGMQAAVANAVPSSASNTQPPSDSAANESVYVTVSGTKYHRADCSYLRSTKIVMPLEEALQAGYEPCSRCKP